MTKPKLIVLSITIFILISTSGKVEAEPLTLEPSFDSAFAVDKSVSPTSLETALANNGLDQLGHGLLMLALVSLLAFRKHKKT